MAPNARPEAAAGQTFYMYYSDSNHTTLVGHAIAGCGDPYTLIWGEETSDVVTWVKPCPS